MSQDEDQPDAPVSSFPISSPTFWNEAAKVSTPPPPFKRPRTPEPVKDEDDSEDAALKRPRHRSPSTTLAYLPNRTGPIGVDDPHSYLVNAEYAPNRFGDIGDYMRKKEIKVQTQNRDIALASMAAGLPPIFAGLSFYINGNTHPPMEELRKMILQRGGEVRPVLRSKGMVKFIIAPMLTQSKFKQFERYRVVREGWIVESCNEGKLLDWSRWKLQILGGWEEGSRGGMGGFGKRQPTQSQREELPDEVEMKAEAREETREAAEEEVKEEMGMESAAPFEQTLPSSSVSLPPRSSATRSLLAPLRPSVPARSTKTNVDTAPPVQPKTNDQSRPYQALLPPDALSDQLLTPVTPTRHHTPVIATTSRPTRSPMIPISPGAVREETPTREKLPAKVHKPEGVWEFYHSKESNEDAARLMKNQEWRSKNTAERGNEGGFIDGYYQNSR